MSMKKLNKRRRNPDRTALLICCTREEAERIRLAARRERRSISAFVMNAIMSRFAVEGRLKEWREQVRGERS